MLDISEYIMYCINNEYPLDMLWVYDMFTIINEKEYEDNYIKIEDKYCYLKQDDELLLITKTYGKDNKPIIMPTDKITINSFINNLVDKLETTIGTALMNYILLYTAFKDKIPYINDKFKSKEILNTITNMMLSKDILVEEYLTFVDNLTLLKNYTEVYNISATEKSIIKTPGIDEYKDKIIKEYIDKYGENVFKDKNKIIEIESLIEKYEYNFIKDDPSYGKLVTGKVVGARKKMFASYGIGMEFNVGDDPKYIPKSLYDGYDMSSDKLAIYFNDARLGSYSRGVETQKGGVIPKISLRATNDILILDKDCGTKLTEKLLLTKENKSIYLNRYIIVDGKTINLTEEVFNKYLNKEVNLRTPRYCKEDRNYCLRCTSSILKDRENIISLLVSEVGGTVLNDSMSKLHNTSVKVTQIDIKDFFT
jgi:hypothetical protein